jgi:cyclic beta-1,2-glucan synthetase
MYRIGLEAILGLSWRGEVFTLDPCIPGDWRGLDLIITCGQTRYDVTVENPAGVERGVDAVELDGVVLADGLVPLADDGATHRVRVRLGRQATGSGTARPGRA